MSEVPVFRFKAPGPWVTRDLRDCVLASDYDALAAQLAAAEREVKEAREAEDYAKTAWDEAERERAALREAAGKVANDMDDIATDIDLLGLATAKQQLRAVSADLRAILQERQP